MRKFFHIFLIFSLLISTAGYAVTKHFCGEVLAHISLGNEAASCCDTMEMPTDCDGCENETDHLVVDDNFQQDQQEIKINPALQATLLDFIKFLVFAPVANQKENKLHSTLDYPPFSDPDIHIRVQSLLL